MYCSPLWFNSTSSSIKQLKTSYDGALSRLLLIKKLYRASTMFVTHEILFLFELLQKCIYIFSQRISFSSYSIITACMYLSIHQSDNGEDQCHFNDYFLTVIYLFLLYVCIFYNYVLLCI